MRTELLQQRALAGGACRCVRISFHEFSLEELVDRSETGEVWLASVLCRVFVYDATENIELRLGNDEGGGRGGHVFVHLTRIRKDSIAKKTDTYEG